MIISKIKSSFKEILREMIPVILGILIALWINNWQNNKQNQAFLSHVYQTIQEEHSNNITELKETIPTHRKLVDTIYHSINDENIFIGKYPEMVGGLSVALIGNTSWKSFINSQIQLVDFKLVKLLSDIDNLNEAYKIQTKRLTDFFFENLENTTTKDKGTLIFILEDLVTIEKDVLKSHLELKGLLEKELN